MVYAIDLFSGAGGMSEGIIQAGFHIVYSSDINEDVEKTYVERHKQLGLHQGVNTHFERADIRNLSSNEIINSIKNLDIFKNKPTPNIDAIFGGPPCQGFSRAGKRDKKDPRNMLFKEYLRIINDIRPNYVVMENVEGFLDTRLDGFIGVTGEQYPDDMLMPELLNKEFELIGYHTLQSRILDASDYGVPQRRRRVIFLAYLDGCTPPSYPIPTTRSESEKLSVLDAIGDLIIDPDKKKNINYKQTQYQLDSMRGRTRTLEGELPLNNSTIENHETSTHTALVKERFSLFKQGESAGMLKRRILSEGIDISDHPLLIDHCIKNSGGLYNKDELIALFKKGAVDEKILHALLTKKNSRYRLNQDEVSPTMVTLPDDYLTPFEDRIPTVREMARIQSFDDSFKFLGKRTTGGRRRSVEVPQYTQVGNAVPPLLAKEVALEIKKAIKNSSKNLQIRA